MTQENVITREAFDTLLVWLDPDRETAAGKYEKIRWQLIRIFFGRGCYEAERLADETFNRVTGKLPEIISSYTGDPVRYFFGVANNIHLEWVREQKKQQKISLSEREDEDTMRLEIEDGCLTNCLRELPVEQRRFIIEYYQKEKSSKIKQRRRLAENLGLSANALQIKALRIRARLKECLRNCIAEKSAM